MIQEQHGGGGAPLVLQMLRQEQLAWWSGGMMLEGGDVGPADSQSQTDTDCEAACMSQHHLNIGQKTILYIHYLSNSKSMILMMFFKIWLYFKTSG